MLDVRVAGIHPSLQPGLRFDLISQLTSSIQGYLTYAKVIIDNMMNIELLFVGAEITGNDTYRQHAISHANKTMMNHVRPDGASHCVVPVLSYTITEGI